VFTKAQQEQCTGSSESQPENLFLSNKPQEESSCNTNSKELKNIPELTSTPEAYRGSGKKNIGTLTCLYLNVRSVSNNFHHLEALFSLHKPSIIDISELWGYDNIGDAEINLQGYAERIEGEELKVEVCYHINNRSKLFRYNML